MRTQQKLTSSGLGLLLLLSCCPVLDAIGYVNVRRQQSHAKCLYDCLSTTTAFMLNTIWRDLITQPQLRRIHKAWTPPPTFTNGWALGAPWVEEQQTRNWPNCTDHHESAHQNDYCTFRAKKWRGTTSCITRMAQYTVRTVGPVASTDDVQS